MSCAVFVGIFGLCGEYVWRISVARRLRPRPICGSVWRWRLSVSSPRSARCGCVWKVGLPPSPSCRSVPRPCWWRWPLVNLLVLHTGLIGPDVGTVGQLGLLGTGAAGSVRHPLSPDGQLEHITESLRYAIPVVLMYVAYFVLNRFSTLVLQRHAPVAQIAIFGLAQQLATIVTVVGNGVRQGAAARGVRAEPSHVMAVVRRSASICRSC